MAFSIRRSLAWMTISQAGQAVTQFGASLVLARLLSPYETGVFAMAAAVAGVLGMLRTIGLSNYVIRAASVDRDFLAGVFTVNAALAVAVSILIVGMSLLGGHLLGEPGVRDVLLALAIVPLLSSLELLPSACIERQGNFRVISMVNLGRNLVATGVMLTAAFAGHSYMSLAYGQLAGAVTAVIAINIAGRHHASLRFGLTGWHEITRYGLDMLATTGVVQLYMRLSEFMVGWLLGLHALGLYARASGLLTIMWENFQLIILRVIYVDLVAQKRMGLSFRSSYLRVLSVATAFLWPAFGGVAVVAGPLLLTLYGAQWVDAHVALSLLMVGAVIGTTILMTWELFLAANETRRMVRLQAIQCGFGVVAFGVGCLFGIAGAAMARVVEAMFNVVLYRPHLARLTDTTLRDVLPIMGQGMVLMMLAVTPAGLVMLAHGWSPSAPLAQVLGGIAAGVVCWVIGLRVLDHPLWGEFRRLTGRITGSPVAGPTP
ncbi:MAG: oligosaccharide flippase family protein [Alphaproteobacteria bacterium]|nr:oligosaccharide flippase family protein [Alphaproteobacteria bacterium]